MTKYKKNDIKDSYYVLRDAANLYASGLTKSDKRIQVKMPSFVVDQLDKEFPEQDRSSVITNAAIDLLLRKKRNDDPRLEHWIAEEQTDLDRMHDYLDKREKDES